MIRATAVGPLVVLMLALVPSPAAADATVFWGASTSPTTRSARGFAIGISLIVVGFEAEYASTVEGELDQAPGLRTGMVNGLLQTPTRTQLYVTAGAGLYRERLGDDAKTGIATNIGGGLKMSLAGPLRLRLDYRVFTLRGSPTIRNPQRLYAGLNLAF